MDQNLRLTFLFQGAAQRFIGLFSQRRPRMEQFLTELEENAVQLDRMKLGAKISSVAGSSVGAAGGILSIVGLALTPVTAGVSLALTIAGVSLGVTSGVNSITTGITEMKVNSIHEKKPEKSSRVSWRMWRVSRSVWMMWLERRRSWGREGWMS